MYLVTQSYNYKGEKETKYYDKYFEKGFFGNVIASRETSASNQGYFVFDNLNLTREITYDNPEYSDHQKNCRIRIEQLAREREERLEELEKERQKEISNPRIISRGTGRHPRILRDRAFLSCLCGSNPCYRLPRRATKFLSCLCGSNQRQKYL